MFVAMVIGCCPAHLGQLTGGMPHAGPGQAGQKRFFPFQPLVFRRRLFFLWEFVRLHSPTLPQDRPSNKPGLFLPRPDPFSASMAQSSPVFVLPPLLAPPFF